MIAQPESYPARLEVDYPEQLNRLTTLLRVIWIIPILVILTILSGGEEGIATGLAVATALMIVVRQPTSLASRLVSRDGFVLACLARGIVIPQRVHRRWVSA